MLSNRYNVREELDLNPASQESLFVDCDCLFVLSVERRLKYT